MSGSVIQDFSMGRVVSRTFAVLGRNLLPVGAIALVVELISVALSLGAGMLLGRLLGAGQGVTAAAGLVGVVIGLVVGSVATGAITVVAVHDLDGRRLSFGPALAAGVRLALPLAGLGIVAGLGIAAASLLLVIPGIMLALRWFVAVPARVVEGPGIGAALNRSAELTAGFRWRLFWLGVAWVLLVGILAALVDIVALRAGGMDGTTRLVMLGIFRVVISTITTAISSTGFAACYVELRAARDGATPRDLAAVFA